MKIKESSAKLRSGAANVANATAGAVGDFVKDVASQLGKHGNTILEDNPKVKGAVDATGNVVKEVKKQTREVVEHLTGEAALAQAEKLLEQQRCYNDILATRLAEALERIAMLESRLNEMDNKK